MRRLAKEFYGYLETVILDMTTGWRFWGAVLLALFPAIIGAVAISAHNAYLTPRIITADVKYVALEQDKHEEVDRDTAARRLEAEMRSRLNRRAAAIGDDKRPPANTEIFTEDMDKEQFLTGVGLLQIDVSVSVKNIGGLASSVTGMRVSIVEEIDGQRRPLERAPDAQFDLKIEPQQTVQLGPQTGNHFYFQDAFWTFMDYETIGVLNRNLAWLKADRVDGVKAYAQILKLGSKRAQSDIDRLADPNKHCRLILVAEVYDSFGHKWVVEKDLLTLPGGNGSEYMR